MAQRIDGVDPLQDISLEIARGRVTDVTSIDKFGLNPGVGSTFEPITDLGVQNYPASALAMTVTSDAGADDNGVEVTVIGLDENWEDTSQTVTLAGTGSATTTQTFRRVFRAYVSNGQESTDTITISNGATNYAQIGVDYQQTLMAVYTVPAGKKGYLLSGNLSSQKDKDITAKLMVRQESGVFQTKGIILTPGTPFQRTWSIPQEIPAKTDIEIRAKAGASGPVAAGFEILLVDE